MKGFKKVFCVVVIIVSFVSNVSAEVVTVQEVLDKYNVEKVTNTVTLGQQSQSFDFNLLVPKEGVGDITLLKKYVTDLQGNIIPLEKGIEPNTTFYVVFDFENATNIAAVGEQIKEKFDPRLIPEANAYLVTSVKGTGTYKTDWSKSQPLSYTNLQGAVVLDVLNVQPNTEGKIFLAVTYKLTQ